MAEEKKRRTFLKYLFGVAASLLLAGKDALAGPGNFVPLSNGSPREGVGLLAKAEACKQHTGPCDKEGLICKSFHGPCRKEVACQDHAQMKCSAREYTPACRDHEQCSKFVNTRKKD